MAYLVPVAFRACLEDMGRLETLDLKGREGQRESEEILVNPIPDNQDPQEYKVPRALTAWLGTGGTAREGRRGRPARRGTPVRRARQVSPATARRRCV